MFNKLLLIGVLMLIQFNTVFSQTNSPYSYAGLGERTTSNQPVFSGMGNNFVTYAYPSALNTYNPATYSSLRYQFPIFSLGLSNRFSSNQVNGVKESNYNSSLSEIALGLSFAKRFGLAFGLKPFQKKSYSFVNQQPLLTDSVKYEYLGSGNLNLGFIGFSVNVLNFDSLKWSVGGNIGVLFGEMTDVRRSSLVATSSSVGGIDTKSQSVKSFHYDLGTLVQYKIKNGHSISFGATFEPLQNISSKYSRQLAFSLTDVTDPNTYNILTETGDLNGKIVFAPNYTLGLAYSAFFKTAKKDGNTRKSQLLTSISYSSTDWSKYRENYGDSSYSYNLNSSSGFQLGLQFIPETQYIGSATPKFFERINYRLGFYSNTLPYVFNNEQLKEWGATLGFGIPILVDKRLDSSIQFGLACGRRSTNQVGGMNETFIGANIGIFVAPSINDRWFIKRKLD